MSYKIKKIMKVDIQIVREKVLSGLKSKLPSINESVLNRMNYELKVIEDYNLVEYYLVYIEIIKICNDKNFLRSPGRGFAAGSLVNYGLDITKINPLENDLLFERFINTKINETVNIAIDIPQGKRYDLILELNNVLKSFDVFQLLIPSLKKNDYEKVYVNNEEYYVHPCATYVLNKNLDYDFETFHIGKFHYLIFNDNLENLASNNYDVLELDYLSMLEQTYDLIGDEKLHPYSLPLNDLKTFEKLEEEGGVGVFQFDNISMKKILHKFRPVSNLDLAIINAVFAPRGLDNLYKILEYKRDKAFDSIFCIQKESPFVFEQREINETLQKNYGVLVFQEDINILMHKIAGFDMNTAEYFRRLLFKNENKEEIEKMRRLFKIGCEKKSDLSKQEIPEFIKLIESSCKKDYPKSHALCYSMIAYWGAYYRAHFNFH